MDGKDDRSLERPGRQSPCGNGQDLRARVLHRRALEERRNRGGEVVLRPGQFPEADRRALGDRPKKGEHPMAPEATTRRIVSRLLLVIAFTFGLGEVLMSQTSTPSNVKNIVLVHGGFVDGSGWEGVYKALKKD